MSLGFEVALVKVFGQSAIGGQSGQGRTVEMGNHAGDSKPDVKLLRFV